MGMVKGQKEFKRFEKGGSLTRKEAILAHCYQCNGFEESGVDCVCGGDCPMYEYHPHKS
jgi:hypothetical protein